MNVTTIKIGAPRAPDALYLGRVGENLTRQIIFDCAAFVELYGAGTAEIVAKLPDGTKYLPANVEQDGGTVIWTISEADVGQAGTGRAELSWLVGEAVAKTRTWRTVVRQSLAGTGESEPPDPYKDWVDKLDSRVRTALDSMDTAQKRIDTITAAGTLLFCAPEKEE